MKAIDANVLVRYLIGDDQGQVAKARAVIAFDRRFIGTAKDAAPKVREP